MRADLLDAVACIDWADAQLPSFEQRINAWLDCNFHVEIKDVDRNQPNNVIVAIQKEPLPIFFNVEFGCLINTIRSSLDILATTLVKRHTQISPDQAYFPIAKSAEHFAKGNFKGVELMRALPNTERRIFEDLKPYKGGNEPLWLLHQLDIMRKHRRLLTVVCLPSQFQITGWGLSDYYTTIQGGFMRVSDIETVVGIIAKSAPQCEMRATGRIVVDEGSSLIRKPAIALICDFSGLARSIINHFDVP